MLFGNLGGCYQSLESIDRSSTSIFYRAYDMQTGHVVVIKILHDVYNTDLDFGTCFQREMKESSTLQHPTIVQVYDYGQSDGKYFVVVEPIDGTDLRRYVRSRGILPVDRAMSIAHDVALGLSAAHRRGIVHHNVNPQNILVRRDGSIKLTDFGMYSSVNIGVGLYCAPEEAVTPVTDVYALGIVLYEMLTGRTPFEGDTLEAVAMHHIQDAPVPPSQLNPSIPPTLEAIILRCLQKVPQMRFRNGFELAHSLEDLGNEASMEIP